LWPQWLKTFISSKLPRALTIVMVLLVSYFAAKLTWDVIVPLFWKKTPLTQTATKISVTNPGLASTAKADYTFISELHLFGYTPVVKKQPKATPQVAPVTKTRLTLHGIFVFSGPKDGAAIIGEAGKNQRFYRTGDKIQKDMELVEVRNDHVLLLRNGRFETLRFPGLKKLPTSQKAKTQPAAQDSAVDVKEYRQLFQKHPEKIAEHFDIMPVFENGVLKGYRVKPQSNRSLYDELGLQPDDLLVAVNGIPLNDRSQLSEVIAEISSAELLTVNLLRNKKQETLLLDLR
jgi:general secretion pathway protein C